MKANKDGRECAPWCITDHAGQREWDCQSESSGPSRAHATVYQGDHQKDPSVYAWLAGGGDFWALTASTSQLATWMANSLDVIAGMRKPEIRALAANVRKAAAEAYPEKEAEAS